MLEKGIRLTLVTGSSLLYILGLYCDHFDYGSDNNKHEQVDLVTINFDLPPHKLDTVVEKAGN